MKKCQFSKLDYVDYVGIVKFSTTAEYVPKDNKFLRSANINTREDLIQKIDQLEAIGLTNFYDAFKIAFEMLKVGLLDDIQFNFFVVSEFCRTRT